MGHISLYDAKTHLSGLVDRAAGGEEFVIAKNGVPMAKLVPLPKVTAPRTPARTLGITRIAPDFDDSEPRIEALFAGGEADDELDSAVGR
ncbi:prevent-host-death family protein [Azospirillum brasilense]|uniref:Antitoxin n=1 Tax=Azospirillum brasilense TaxID=192 RepID=A0A560BBJ7_AZOBR|nr:type II toxin-antitoxin system prevent-host-death family antitoxin [Azospirillum brasilense]TWA69956.1 prevent-host-death family protein [Azospirillum brasilense]